MMERLMLFVLGIAVPDAYISNAIEREALAMAGLVATISSADISAREGRLVLSDFYMGDPAGFAGGGLIIADSLTVVLNIDEERKKTADGRSVKHLKQIKIEAPRLLLEITEEGSNFQAVIQNIDQWDAQGSSLYVIDKFLMKDASLSIISSEETNSDIVVDMPPLELNNVGDFIKPLTRKQLGQTLMRSIAQAVGEATRTADPNRLDNLVGGASEMIHRALDIPALPPVISGGN
ncbi:MAG: hypothetical protein V6Z81_01865 [Parvularculales bacterium]